MKLLDLSVLRQIEPGDYFFIISSFAHSYKRSSWAGTVPANIWHVTAKATVDGLLARGATVLLSVSADDRDQILGWICFETGANKTPVVHYVFVKEEFRKEGIAHQLLTVATKEGPFLYTHRTDDGNLLTRGKQVLFRPWLARRKNLEPVPAINPKKTVEVPCS